MSELYKKKDIIKKLYDELNKLIHLNNFYDKIKHDENTLNMFCKLPFSEAEIAYENNISYDDLLADKKKFKRDELFLISVNNNINTYAESHIPWYPEPLERTGYSDKIKSLKQQIENDIQEYNDIKKIYDLQRKVKQKERDIQVSKNKQTEIENKTKTKEDCISRLIGYNLTQEEANCIYIGMDKTNYGPKYPRFIDEEKILSIVKDKKEKYDVTLCGVYHVGQEDSLPPRSFYECRFVFPDGKMLGNYSGCHSQKIYERCPIY